MKVRERNALDICVEIFAIGNELCYGKVYDTNSFWIADQVTQLGAKVQRITCIPDSLESICNVMKEAIDRRPNIIIVTGGLGPTPDDLTIEALSRLLGLKLETRRTILQSMAERRKMPIDQLPPNLVRMARTLTSAECLPNPVGSAPVTLIEKDDTMIVALPGPPTEMKACFAEYLTKRIRERTHLESASKRVLISMYESQLSPLIEQIMKEMPGTYLKPLVSEYQRDKGLLPVEIIAFAESTELCQKRMDEIIEKLGAYVSQRGGNLQLP